MMLALSRFVRGTSSNRALLKAFGTTRPVAFFATSLAESNEEHLIQSPGVRYKLKAILDDYRQVNYTQEVPSRAVKEILQAADENHDGMISLEEVEHLLDHIDKKDKLTHSEIHEILNDLGADDKDMVPVQTIKELLSQK